VIYANAELLERARSKNGMTKKDLAKKIGSSHSVIVRAEQSKGVSPSTAKKLCEALGLDFDELFKVGKRGELHA